MVICDVPSSGVSYLTGQVSLQPVYYRNMPWPVNERLYHYRNPIRTVQCRQRKYSQRYAFPRVRIILVDLPSPLVHPSRASLL